MAVFVFPPISISSGPVQFNLNGVPTQVSKDTVTPSNSRALPVELTGTSGPINITAGDLNVQLTDQGLNPDVTRIGDGTNQLAITAGNAAKVDGSAVTQPVSAASLPLPSGAATEAKQDTGNTSLSNIDNKIPSNLTVTSTRLLVDGSGVTQPISAAALPLPSGAATEAKQDTGNTSLSNIDGKLQVNGVADLNNTTTTLLGVSGNYTGSWTDVTKYNSIVVGLKSDVASATDGFRFEYSHDGISVDHAHVYTYSAADGIDYHFGAGFKYVRVNYTNGAVAQTIFSITTTLKSSAMFPSSYRIAQTLTDQFSALITKGVIVGKSTAGGGTYVDVKVNPSGALAADVTGSVSVSNFPATQPISAASLPLPTGAATESTLSSLNSKIPGSLTVTSTRLLVDGSGVIQPVSGSVSITNLPASQTVDGTVAVSNLPAALGQTTMAGSTSVTIASNQTAIPTTPGALTASFQEVLNLTTVAQTVTPPASAKWVKIYADNTNSNNIRVRLAGTATTSSGISMEPGRTEDFSVVGTGISIIAEAGTNQKINFHFGA